MPLDNKAIEIVDKSAELDTLKGELEALKILRNNELMSIDEQAQSAKQNVFSQRDEQIQAKQKEVDIKRAEIRAVR